MELSDHDKAMIAKADAEGVAVSISDGQGGVTPVALPKEQTADVNSSTPAATEEKKAHTKPEHVPDKYWNAETGVVNYEAWAKSTRELEQRFHEQRQQKPADAAKKADEKPAEGEAPKTGDEQQQQEPAADPAKVIAEVRQRATEELTNSGQLSDETYEALAKQGYDRATVDDFIEGQRARNELYNQRIVKVAGGSQEDFNKMVEWAKANYSPEEAVAFDAAVNSRKDGEMTLAVQGLVSRYKAAVGSSGKRVEPNSAPVQPTGDRFNSKDELVEAMSDPKYKKGDAAYHAMVARKIANSAAANIDIGLY